MERRQRPEINGTWARPRYGNNLAPGPARFSHDPPQRPPSYAGPQAPPRVVFPDSGAQQRAGPWEGGLHYEAGWPGGAPQEAAEQRAPHGDFPQHGYHEPQQHGGAPCRPPLPEVFRPGGTRPGMPPRAPLQPVRARGMLPQPGAPHYNLQRAADLYARMPSEALQSPSIRNDGPVPHIPPQGVMQYSAPRDGAQQASDAGFPGRPQPMIPASPQENVSEPRSQDVGQRLNRHDDMYKSGERYYNVQPPRGPQHVPDEHQDPVYAERSERPDAYQPDFLHRGGPDPVLSQYPSGRQPAGFQYDFPPSRHTYKEEGAQPGMYHGGAQAGLYNVNTPPVPDTVNYRAPSPGIPQFSPHLQPAQNTPPQANYHVPPVHGNPPRPSYALHPLVGSGFGISLAEGDSEVPRLQRHYSHPNHLLNPQQVMFQDGRQGLDPLMPSGRHFEHSATFHQPEVPDGLQDPDLLPQHGSPFVSHPAQHIKDNFMYSERQTDLEKSGPADKEAFMQWLSSFLSRRGKKPPSKSDTVEAYSIAEARELIYGAFRLVSQLDSLCQVMESSDEAGKPWTCDYEKAADIRVDIENRLEELEKPGYIRGVKRKLDRVRKKRLRSQRRRQATEEDKQAAEYSAEKEASIDLWRVKCIREVEEKKRNRELKATADSVLGEVRKKQHDVKKMLDVLKSLEKLRKLRKEAAGRKGVCPPPSADETFTNHIKRLRAMVRKRSALYDAEEKTLRVILEGEQEEERQRENDKRLKKEKEKVLQKQRELDSVLFGDTETLHSLHPLQPFRQYYLQAEHSVVSLVQIRHEWDQFLVPLDHPDGCSIPHGWVVPTPPSNDTWATALKQSD